MVHDRPPEPPLLLAVALDLAWPVLAFDICWLATAALTWLERLAHP